MPGAPEPIADLDADAAAIRATLGQAIVSRRRHLGITQQALAHAIGGSSRTFLRGIESGDRAPSVVTLTKIARALDTTPSALLADIS